MDQLGPYRALAKAHQQKVGIWPPYRYGGFLNRVFKGTFRAQTGAIVYSHNFLVLRKKRCHSPQRPVLY